MDDTAKAQEEVLAFLADPATYGGGVEKVRRIDTHAASVFLAGDRALKIKRAVRFPFLDYSTLAKRKAACAAEIEVNRRLAPELYRGVVAITRDSDGRLALGGDGEPVEWAVDMVRFDENRTLDHLVNEIDDDLADALGRAVAAAHETAPVVDAEPWIKALGSYIDEHVEAFAEHREIFPAADIEALAEKSRAHYRRIVPLLRQRGRRGLVRRIHGDLHLGNIALIDGRPVLFDAIEFSAVIGSGDVLYDLAFLLMDLARARAAASGQYRAQPLPCRNAQGRRPRCAGGAAVLPVDARRDPRQGHGGADGARQSGRARQDRHVGARLFRFRAAGDRSCHRRNSSPSAACPAPARRGWRARWRSHIAPMPGAVVVRSDVERKTLFGTGETEKLPAAAYAPDVTARVYGSIADKARRIVTAGHSAIVDAVFATPQERDALAAAAKAAKIPLRGLFLTADLATRIARVGGRAKDASDADAAVAQAQENYELGALTWPKIDASGTLVETLGRARAALSADPRPGQLLD